MTCEVAPDWVSTIKRTLESRAEVGWIGGKVLPRWAATPPSWLTRDHWSPLAAQDHGDVPFSSSGRQVCLVGANLAFRKDLLEQFGGFRPDRAAGPGLGRVDGGSRAANPAVGAPVGTGLYVPELSRDVRCLGRSAR